MMNRQTIENSAEVIYWQYHLEMAQSWPLENWPVVSAMTWRSTLTMSLSPSPRRNVRLVILLFLAM